MNTSSVFKGFTYRCSWVPEVQVAMHGVLSVVIVKALQRNSYKMNYLTGPNSRVSKYRRTLSVLLKKFKGRRLLGLLFSYTSLPLDGFFPLWVQRSLLCHFISYCSSHSTLSIGWSKRSCLLIGSLPLSSLFPPWWQSAKTARHAH